jgi:hypothetical protein
MPKTLILNSSNIAPNSGNSVFIYNFPQGGVTFKDDLIAVQQVSIYNSVFNVSSSNQNTSFSYIWVDGTINPVVMPNSYLELDDINAYMQSIMIANTHYLKTTTGDNVYLLNIAVNPSRYAYQINSFLISVAIAATNTWTLPVGATWVLPTNPIMPMLRVLNNNFQQLIGYTAGDYPNTVISGVPPAQIQTPAQSTTYSTLSSTSPQIIPQPSYLALCSLVNNRYSIPSQLLYSITPTGVSFGSLYTVQVADLAFNKITDGTYNQFTFSFVDGNGRPINFQDPNMLILLVIKNKSEMNY